MEKIIRRQLKKASIPFVWEKVFVRYIKAPFPVFSKKSGRANSYLLPLMVLRILYLKSSNFECLKYQCMQMFTMMRIRKTFRSKIRLRAEDVQGMSSLISLWPCNLWGMDYAAYTCKDLESSKIRSWDVEGAWWLFYQFSGVRTRLASGGATPAETSEARPKCNIMKLPLAFLFFFFFGFSRNGV